MFDSLWQWGLLLLLFVYWGEKIFVRWVGVRLGVRPNLAMLTQLEEFMKVVVYADQLVQKGEIGQAMLVLDELIQRPETAKVPAMGAQVHFHRARLLQMLNRHDDGLPSARTCVGFLREVYAQQRTVANAASLGEALHQLAQIHLSREDFAAAIETFEEVRKINKKGAYRQTAIRTELELAKLCTTADECTRGAEHAREARKLAEKWKLTLLAVEALVCEARAVGSAGELDECRRLLEAAELRMPADATAGQRLLLLETRWALEQVQERPRDELAAVFKLMRAICDVKVGRGWRQDQATIMGQLAAVEHRALELGATLALAGDRQATAVYVAALRLLRESYIAHLLRSGTLEADANGDIGLPAVIADLLARISELEDPDSPRPASPAAAAALYEKLEVAASARFRQLVQPPATTDFAFTTTHHLIQVRMIEQDDTTTLYGSWEAPGKDPVPYRFELPADEARALREVTGLTDLRSSTTDWSKSSQLCALSGGGEWRSLTFRLLPPGLISLLNEVSPDAADEDVPLVLISADSLLWTVPWSALVLDDSGALLGDRAAFALVPSCSLLAHERAGLPATTGVLSYLHGVDRTGLSIERDALYSAWPGQVHEASDADDLVRTLAGAADYSVLAMSVHGDNRTGLAHSLLLDPARGTRLSAGRMMRLHFARTVVVGACFSGNLDKRVGTDPTGIPAVMLCRGATTVIGGAFPLPDGPANDHSTATILGYLYAGLATGTGAPWALRRAQLRWRAEHDKRPATWAGLIAISSGNF
ncbi:CHAT domain-containing protein [Allokutzneria sp. A3M-2-11 16]|uniref:CHAT domain-containing protein n=1 Tax=Allokutzneria sp. A3M-2-11 16 TaxID=2962043 RepID=UPI0020B686E8|nr:CHAT domain-containing protein [Allokutzneria sp. A3M-2-11 16]MCP3800684.1 CHAT domain-containing protein [Allokutzneria sp. A3M-2-11 16]